MAMHYDLGKEGEQIAVNYLIDNNYLIREKNWRFKKAEIDIIAQKENTLFCVEVKTRTSQYFGNPQEFVSSKKIKLLVEAMDAYVIQNNLDVEVQFDIIAIIKQNKKTTLNHIQKAFLHF